MLFVVLPGFICHPDCLINNILFLFVNHTAALKHPRTPQTNPSLDYPSVDSDHVAKRTRPLGLSDEVII